MLKRTISLALCLLMVFSLTACSITTGGDEGSDYYVVESYVTESTDGETTDVSSDTSSKKDPASQQETTSNKTSSTTTAVDNKVTGGRFDVDYKGKTVKLLLWYTPQAWEQQIYDDWQKQTGAKIKPITVKDASYTFQKLTALIAANDAPDATMMSGENFPNFITKKLAQPITKYIDKSKDTWLAYDIMDTIKYDGEYYGLTDHFWGGTQFVYFNKKIFGSSTKVNTDPLKLYESGNWNWNTFADLAEKLTVKQGANLAVLGAKYTEVGAFARSAGATVIKSNNGTFTNTIDSKELKDAFTFVQKGVKAGYLDNNKGTWESGNVAMYIFDQYPIRVENYGGWKTANFEWDWVPFPAPPTGTAYQPTSVQVGIVPRKAKNPEIGFNLINFRAYYQENMKATSQSNKAWLERWKKAVTGKTCSSLEAGIMGNKIYNLYTDLSDPTKPIQTTIDSNKTVVKGAIETYEKDKAAFKF